jgi:hypothetical protein
MILKVHLLSGTFAVCRLRSDAPVPDWANDGPFVSITRSSEELSIVCLQDHVPAGTVSEGSWRCFKVEGPLDFGLTGVLASLVQPLAEAEISLFAVSTYDTDYVLVKEEKLERAARVLTLAGHMILPSD